MDSLQLEFASISPQIDDFCFRLRPVPVKERYLISDLQTHDSDRMLTFFGRQGDRPTGRRQLGRKVSTRHCDALSSSRP
jgi:hypothetical protein